MIHLDPRTSATYVEGPPDAAASHARLQRLLWIGLLAVAPAVLLLGFVTGLESGFPRNAAAVVRRYLALRGQAGELWTPADQASADRPWRFERVDSERVIGDSARYQTDLTFSSPVTEGTDSTPAASGIPVTHAGGGAMPLPFPPRAVWCVWLVARAGAPPGQAGERLIFVALHEDLYVGAWLVHESSALGRQRLTHLGCALPAAP
jgi:hypothetical protein